MNNALTKTLTSGLNHGLKVKDTYENKVLYIDYTSQTYDFKHVGLKLLIELNERFKPYLFPMSALTKEIEVGGERFVPIVELKDLGFGDLRIIEDKLCSFVNLCLTIEDMLLLTEQLSMWHFNVFNLSPEEFIEVSQEHNPYK